MHHIHLIHWFLDFIGVHNGEDQFSTRMYNFWSGFGGNISVLALIGTMIGVYRHHLKQLERLNPLNIIKDPLHMMQKKDKEKKE